MLLSLNTNFIMASKFLDVPLFGWGHFLITFLSFNLENENHENTTY